MLQEEEEVNKEWPYRLYTLTTTDKHKHTTMTIGHSHDGDVSSASGPGCGDRVEDMGRETVRHKTHASAPSPPPYESHPYQTETGTQEYPGPRERRSAAYNNKNNDVREEARSAAPRETRETQTDRRNGDVKLTIVPYLFGLIALGVVVWFFRPIVLAYLENSKEIEVKQLDVRFEAEKTAQRKINADVNIELAEQETHQKHIEAQTQVFMKSMETYVESQTTTTDKGYLSTTTNTVRTHTTHMKALGGAERLQLENANHVDNNRNNNFITDGGREHQQRNRPPHHQHHDDEL